jgi:hypothetical protein
MNDDFVHVLIKSKDIANLIKDEDLIQIMNEIEGYAETLMDVLECDKTYAGNQLMISPYYDSQKRKIGVAHIYKIGFSIFNNHTEEYDNLSYLERGKKIANRIIDFYDNTRCDRKLFKYACKKAQQKAPFKTLDTGKYTTPLSYCREFGLCLEFFIGIKKSSKIY